MYVSCTVGGQGAEDRCGPRHVTFPTRVTIPSRELGLGLGPTPTTAILSQNLEAYDQHKNQQHIHRDRNKL